MSNAPGHVAVPPNVALSEEVPNEVESDRGKEQEPDSEEEPDPKFVLLPSLVADLTTRGIIVPSQLSNVMPHPRANTP